MSGIILKETDDSLVPTPATGKACLFIDDADGQPKYKDDTGTVNSMVGPPGPPSGVDSVNGQTGVVVLEASDIDYDNATSGLAASDVQAAIDELAAGGGGSGDVIGPASSTTGNFAVFADGTGKEIGDGGAPGGMAFIDDAPSDGQEYVRKDAAWEVATGGGGGGLTNFTEGVNASSPNATVPYVYLNATNAATNVDVAICPKGTGAYSLHIANGLTSGGNKRGGNAVDLQLSRNAATQVASGIHSFSAGASNTASGSYSFVGGYLNTASASYGVALGRSNNVTSNDSVALGRSNTISAPDAVALGPSNTVSGGFGVAAGTGNTVSGTAATATGASNTASGFASFASGEGSTTGGIRCVRAHASGTFQTLGDAQAMRAVFRRRTTDATPSAATATNSAGSTDNQLTLPNESDYIVKAVVVAREEPTRDSASWDVTVHVKRGANAASTSVLGTPVVTNIAASAGAAAWVASVLADTTNGALSFVVTGEAAHTIKWVVDVYAVARVVL